MLPTIKKIKPDLIGFTDGSVRYGRVGAGGVFHIKQLTKTTSIRLNHETTIFDAERTGITHGIESIIPTTFWSTGIIFSDSLSNISNIRAIRNGQHKHIDIQIYETNRQLSELNRSITLYYIPSHTDIPGNDIADDLAGEATKRFVEYYHATTFQHIRNENRRDAIDEWKVQWKKTEKTKNFYSSAFSNEPDLQIHNLYNTLRPYETRWLIWLRSGFIPLNYIKHKQRTIDSPRCRCGLEEETREHYLLRCPLWNSIREKLFKHIRNNEKSSVPNLIRNEKNLPIIFEYIRQTKRFNNRKLDT